MVRLSFSVAHTLALNSRKWSFQKLQGYPIHSLLTHLFHRPTNFFSLFFSRQTHYFPDSEIIVFHCRGHEGVGGYWNDQFAKRLFVICFVAWEDDLSIHQSLYMFNQALFDNVNCSKGYVTDFSLFWLAF